MSRPLRLTLLGITSFGLLWALSALGLLNPLSPSARASKVSAPAAVGRKRPPPTVHHPAAPLLSSDELLQAQALATTPLAAPKTWQRPNLAAVISRLPSPPPPSPTPDTDPNAPAGSYATFTPNDIGVIPSNPRVSGHLQTILRNFYSRQQQHQDNIALIPSYGAGTIGSFSINFEDPGWYLIALHLSNPSSHPATVTNTVYYRPHGYPRPPFIEDTRTVPPNTSFIIPQLIEIAIDSESFMWQPVSTAGDSHSALIFHALTIDRL